MFACFTSKTIKIILSVSMQFQMRSPVPVPVILTNITSHCKSNRANRQISNGQVFKNFLSVILSSEHIVMFLAFISKPNLSQFEFDQIQTLDNLKSSKN